MNHEESQGYKLVFAAGVLWGIIGVFVKQLENSGSTVEMTSFLRVALAFIIMATICVIRDGIKSLYVDKKTLLICAALGVICHGIYNICYSVAVTTVGVAMSAVLLDVAPVFTLMFSVLLFGERLSVRKLIAILINILGCILTVTNGVLDIRQLELYGILLGMGAGIAYALTAIIGRSATEKTDPLVMSMYSYLFAALFLGIWMKPWAAQIKINLGILIWGFLYALIPTSIAYIIYYQGIGKIKESSKVPVIASVEIVIASIIGVVFYKEHLGIVSIFGIMMVLTSILIMNQSTKKIIHSKV